MSTLSYSPDLAEAAKTLQVALHDAISDSAAIQLVLGDPVRAYDDPPDRPDYPYLTYGDVRSTDTSSDAAPQSNHQISLHVWSRYRGRAEVLDLMRLIQTCVERDVPHTVLPLYIDVVRAADGLTFHGLLRLSVTLTHGVPS